MKKLKNSFNRTVSYINSVWKCPKIEYNIRLQKIWLLNYYWLLYRQQ